MAKIALAFSGGLDTSFLAIWLRERIGAEVVTVTVDTGGFSDQDLAAIAARAAALGITDHRVVNAQADVYEGYISYLIKGDCLRGGTYPVSVGAERTAQAAAIVRVAREIGATAIAHGSTRAGNDQIRFDVAIQALAPDLEVHAPIRDLGWSRKEESDWLAERGIEIDAATVAYSVNEGLFGTTIGGRETHDAWQVPPESVYTATAAPEDAPAEAQEVILGFERGLPVALDGEALGGVDVLRALNDIAGRHGVGRGMHLGDTILGVKGRLAFEAPGPLVVIRAHGELEKLVQTRWQAYWRQMLGTFYGNLLHEGLYFDPVMRDLEAFLDSVNERVTGDVRVRLHQGRLDVVGVRSPHALMDADVAVYGEGASGWSGEDAAGFARLYGLGAALGRRAAERARDTREESEA